MPANQQIIIVILTATLLLICLAVAIVLISVLANRQKNKLVLQQSIKQAEYTAAMALLKIEIKDETLKQLSAELHDNVGQILSLARIHIKTLQQQQPSNAINQAEELTAKALDDIRALSKSLNTNVLNTTDIISNLQLQQHILNNTGKLECILIYDGICNNITQEAQLVMYRIAQEFISNTIKYAQASKLEIQLIINTQQAILMLSDNGQGFDTATTHTNNGLANIHARAKQINAQAILTSELQQGTQLTVTLPLQHATAV
jgi:two-component system, NarL family, sensor kinase